MVVDRVPGQGEVADPPRSDPGALRTRRAVVFATKVTAELSHNPHKFSKRRLAFFRCPFHYRSGRLPFRFLENETAGKVRATPPQMRQIQDAPGDHDVERSSTPG